MLGNEWSFGMQAPTANSRPVGSVGVEVVDLFNSRLQVVFL